MSYLKQSGTKVESPTLLGRDTATLSGALHKFSNATDTKDRELKHEELLKRAAHIESKALESEVAGDFRSGAILRQQAKFIRNSLPNSTEVH